MSDDAPTVADATGARGPVGHATGGGGHRVQVTVFLEPAVHRAAKRRAAEAHLSLSATVAEAAKESLLSTYRSDREQELLKAADRNFHALRRLDGRLRMELAVLREMVGLGVRSFLNHTPPVPDSGKAAALLSGKQRFARYLDLVADNVRGGRPIVGEVDPEGPEPPVPPDNVSEGEPAVASAEPPPVARASATSRPPSRDVNAERSQLELFDRPPQPITQSNGGQP